MKAKDIREKFGTTESELSNVYKEIAWLGDKCKLIYWYEPLSYEAQKQLKKDGYQIGNGDNCLIISW
jgi:hypothetical protein